MPGKQAVLLHYTAADSPIIHPATAPMTDVGNVQAETRVCRGSRFSLYQVRKRYTG